MVRFWKGINHIQFKKFTLFFACSTCKYYLPSVQIHPKLRLQTLTFTTTGRNNEFEFVKVTEQSPRRCWVSQDQWELQEDALEETALICVISCNGQSLLKVPCLLMSQRHLYCAAKIFTGCQRADFVWDLGNPSRLLSQNVVLLSKQKFVGNNSLSIKSDITRLVPSTWHVVHTWSSRSQTWPGVHNYTTVRSWNLLPVFEMSLLQTPSLLCKSFLNALRCRHLALLAAFQRSAAPEHALEWARKLHRGLQRQASENQYSALMVSPRKAAYSY